MPYYSELGIYTPSSSYTSPLIKGPYSSHSSILASNILPPSSKQFSRTNFRGFKPHLMTISESSNGCLPVRRIASPSPVYHTSPKVRVPRPIKINTADIDVSVNRYKKYSPQSQHKKTSSESKSSSPQKELKPPTELKEAKPNTAIRRDRATIRLQTIHQDALEKEIGQIRSWRDNFKPDELVTDAKRQKRTPGEILKEKFLIRSKSKDNVPQLEPPLTRKLSVKKSPSFKDICNELTSDQAVEDLNPGQPVEIRRRQSRQLSHDDLLKEIHRSSSSLSVEEVHILDALLQAENEVGLYDIPPVIEEQPKTVRKRKAAKKKSSEKLGLEEKKTEKQKEDSGILNEMENERPVERRSILKKSSSELSIPDTSLTSHTRLRKDSSLKNMVKDISQVEIEMIPIKQKPIITGSIGDIEEKAKNNLKAIVENLDIEESPKPEKKEKKFRFNVTVQEFPVKRTITAPKYELSKDNFNITQIPCSKKPVVNSLLKKNEQKQVGSIAGDGKVFKKKKEAPTETDYKKKLLKSFSEVQVRNTDQNKLQKSESNDSLTNNFTVTVNRARSDETFANGEKSREGSNKLKIVSIEESIGKVSEIQDKGTINGRIDSSNNKDSIPDTDIKVNKLDSKCEARKTDLLLKATKKELRSDTFLCKSDVKKKEGVPSWTDRFRKEQTKSLEEIAAPEEKEVPKKSVFVDLNIKNDMVTKIPEKEGENIEDTSKASEEKESNKKSEEAIDSKRSISKISENYSGLAKLNVPEGNDTNPKIEEAVEKKEVLNKSISLNDDIKNEIAGKKDNVAATSIVSEGNESNKKFEEVIERKEVPEKSNYVHENINNDVVIKTEKEEKVLAKLEEKNNEKTEEVSIDYIKESSLKTKLKDLKDDQTTDNTPKIEPLPKSSAKLRKEEKPAKDENDNDLDFWTGQEQEKYEPKKIDKSKLKLKDPKTILSEIQESQRELKCQIELNEEIPETPEEHERRMISKRSLVQKATKDDPDLKVFNPPTPPPPEPVKSPSPEPSWAPLQSNRLSQWMHPWKKPEQRENCDVEIFAKPKFIRARHIPRRWNQQVVEDSDSEDSTTSEEDSSSEDSEESEEENEEQRNGVERAVGASTSSNDSGFDSGRAKNNECDVNCHKKCQNLMANLCGINQKLVVEAIEKVRKGSVDSRDSPGNTLTPATNPAFSLDFNDLPEEVSQSSTYQGFQRSGRITPPATTIPRFRKYCVDDFNFLKVLGKGSFGKVLLAELKGTEYYYAIKCLKKDVVLEDDDVECTLIERKVLALGTKHPYLCHLLCTFQTESHLFFVMEYLNGGDLMFHIQVERRFSEARARFYGAEIVSGLRFLHNKGIVYRDLKLDNILLDFDGHVRIADFGMCKLQIFLDRMADTFCGTPDYMAPEIIKGQHYNQCVDWWSFGVLLYEMLLGQSPFSGCDEDELFWSICNEKPVIPRFLSAEASSVLTQFLEKDANKRLGNRFSPHGDIQDHPFFKPIDWAGLESRRLEPPFKPNLQHPLDTQYFDKTFTAERAKLTPIEGGILQSIDQTQFQGFSYTNPNATDK